MGDEVDESLWKLYDPNLIVVIALVVPSGWVLVDGSCFTDRPNISTEFNCQKAFSVKDHQKRHRNRHPKKMPQKFNE